MKISFPDCGSGAGISIRAAINAVLNWRKAKGTPTAARRKNTPQFTPGWDYRPREPLRRRAAVDAARAETAKTLSSGPSAVDANNMIWFDLVDPDPTIEEAKTKPRLWDRAYAGSTYD
jgi:hypothetical protein